MQHRARKPKADSKLFRKVLFWKMNWAKNKGLERFSNFFFPWRHLQIKMFFCAADTGKNIFCRLGFYKLEVASGNKHTLNLTTVLLHNLSQQPGGEHHECAYSHQAARRKLRGASVASFRIT